MQFDPRLRIAEETAYAIECGGFGPVLPSVTITTEYYVPLTCEVRGDDLDDVHSPDLLAPGGGPGATHTADLLRRFSDTRRILRFFQ